MLVPGLHIVTSIVHDTSDVFTLTLEKEGEKIPPFLPGQFNMLYLPGFGEVALSISGNPNLSEGLVHTIRSVGSTTEAMQKLKPGDLVGVRGPFGTHWPLEKEGCDVLVIAGGLGICPVRPLLYQIARNRGRFHNAALLFGTKTPSDLLYKEDLVKWKEAGLTVEVTVDNGDPTWKGNVGVVTRLMKSHIPNPQNTLIYLCGPEIMMQFAIKELNGMPVNEEMIYLSMERNMHCGVGFCGHCQYGPHFVCKNGPVFSYPQVKELFFVKEV